jgi:polyhydroxyalkanoate synthesis regulator protein
MNFNQQLLRRYANRKLYSITESRYITLPEIGAKLLSGNAFVIRDNKTDEDLTVQYLVKALVSVGHFNQVVEKLNLQNIEKTLAGKGFTYHA